LREQSNIALDKVLNLQNHLAQKEDEVKTMQKDVLKLQHENMAKVFYYR
jgi:hypothetical protein